MHMGNVPPWPLEALTVPFHFRDMEGSHWFHGQLLTFVVLDCRGNGGAGFPSLQSVTTTSILALAPQSHSILRTEALEMPWQLSGRGGKGWGGVGCAGK